MVMKSYIWRSYGIRPKSCIDDCHYCVQRYYRFWRYRYRRLTPSLSAAYYG